jgi:SAM-dependent methyltransferase
VPQEKVDDIYLDGRHYDRLFDGGGADLPFWLSLVHQYGDPVLELACGTGRVSLVLAEAGFRVAGLDRSEGMLGEARRKSHEAGLDVEWVAADMRDFELRRAFSLVILPGNALCHLLDLGGFESCMAHVRKHLAPHGRFAIDVFVPKMGLLINCPGARSPFAEYDDPEGRGRIVVTESYVYERDTQIKRVTFHRAIPGVTEEVDSQLNLRMFFPQELDALLKYNGFVIEGKYGGYDRSAFDVRSEKQLIVSRPATARMGRNS